MATVFAKTQVLGTRGSVLATMGSFAPACLTALRVKHALIRDDCNISQR